MSKPTCGFCHGTNLYITGDEYACADCEKREAEERPARTYTLTAERLEAMLRECIGSAQHVYLGPVRRRATADSIIASALAEIEKELA